MDFPPYFADAESSFNAASYVIYGIPYEHTSSFRHGADNAPQDIRQASWNYETYNIRTKTNLENIAIHDFGNLTVKDLQPQQMKINVTNFSEKLIETNKFGIALGGDHSITPGIIQSLPKDTIVISLDAHLDYRREYENNPMSHACVTRRIAEILPPEQIYVIGIRSAEQQEYQEAQQDGIHIYDNFILHNQDFSSDINQLHKKLKSKSIYLTIDIDVIDPAYAPATSTPEPFGLTPFEILTILDHFTPNLISMDLVEVCPGYDHGQTALLAAKIIREIIAIHSKYKEP
jgi:agmatinase